MAQSKKINQQLAELEKIIKWFEAQEEADIEEGLKKVKQGAELIDMLKNRLADTENQFREIKAQLDTEA